MQDSGFESIQQGRFVENEAKVERKNEENFLLALAASALLIGSNAQAAECGDVVIGEMNWASGEFLARLDGFILKEGYGCNVSYLTAGTTPQITSMNENRLSNASKTFD